MGSPADRPYYVYVYIDPRNFEEFYYGKGKGSRKLAHLSDGNDSEKVRRIRAIAAEGLQPIIKTVAAGLTEAEAHLIETTLIWRLGRTLTNQAAGKFTSLFRPQNSLHKNLSGFDFQNGIYYFNVGEGPYRNWDDCRKHGFVSAGAGAQWRDQILDIAEGDVLVAYLKGHGYVGVGRVTHPARPYLEFRVDRKLLHDAGLVAPGMTTHAADPDRCEYPIAVEWIQSVPREQAKWQRKAGLFTTQLVKASLDGQPETLRFVEAQFGVKLDEWVR
jgi:uncharacterized protein